MTAFERVEHPVGTIQVFQDTPHGDSKARRGEGLGSQPVRHVQVWHSPGISW